MPRAISSDALKADGTYNFYCRYCGRIHTQANWPIMCVNCGNIEIEDGWGVSGDNSLSNTTVTIPHKQQGRNYLAVGTIDLPR